MGWTEKVRCAACGGNEWDIVKGVWTCPCRRPMTSADVAVYHKTLCQCPAKERVLVNNVCQTCHKPMT